MSSIDHKTDGLRYVIERNAFYRDGYYRTASIAVILLIINLFLATMVGYQWLHPTPAQYFAATSDGRIIQVHPLTDPSLADDRVLQWTADAVRKSFAWDFIHWRRQLQDASENYTPYGWKNFQIQLKDSNNLNTLISQKMVAEMQLTGAPEVVRKGVISGHYAWNIRIPALLKFVGKDKTIPVPTMLTVIVLREPVQYYPDKIAINNIFADTTSVNAS